MLSEKSDQSSNGRSGRQDEVIARFFYGKAVTVVGRIGTGITRLGDLDVAPNAPEVHALVLSSRSSVNRELRENVMRAAEGDAIFVYCSSRSQFERLLRLIRS
ncbi:hypothetical protein G5S35_36870 [Paraburkholderia tropica]|uniref:hypothetical protein n=1 Tax=Paraburkholderia tropica TaxID=92647 RepID=UPI0015FFA273|nr:hypothetical protein [Paraburkholderia tropica]QNB16022.1 hypothetical protein G5S35_36870 [Paraburkholderia tropica]